VKTFINSLMTIFTQPIKFALHILKHINPPDTAQSCVGFLQERSSRVWELPVFNSSGQHHLL